jgi:hypothetical protein
MHIQAVMRAANMCPLKVSGSAIFVNPIVPPNGDAFQIPAVRD